MLNCNIIPVLIAAASVVMPASLARADTSGHLDLQYKARQIVAHKCWKCHGSERDEGDLRLHTRKHIIESGTVDLETPHESKLLQRISLPEGHKKIMPSESKPLPPKEIAILTQWLEGGLKWEGRGAFKEAPLALRKVEAVANTTFSNAIDKHVDQYFKAQQIAWKPMVDDRVFLRRAMLVIFGVLWGSFLIAEAADLAPTKPNFIVIFTDDQGYADLGCFGSENIKTPHIDQMAAEGRKFTSFFVASSVCTPRVPRC